MQAYCHGARGLGGDLAGAGGFQELSGLIAALSWVFIDFWALSFREMAGGTGKLPVGW